MKADTHVGGGLTPADVVTVPVMIRADRRLTLTLDRLAETLTDWAELVTVQLPAGPSSQPPPRVASDFGPPTYIRMFASAGKPLSTYSPSASEHVPPSHSQAEEIAETQAN